MSKEAKKTSREVQIELGNPYPQIAFRSNYKSFEEFKAELEDTHVFKAVPHKERTAELKKAYKFATSKKNGNVSNSTTDGAKADSGKGS